MQPTTPSVSRHVAGEESLDTGLVIRTAAWISNGDEPGFYRGERMGIAIWAGLFARWIFRCFPGLRGGFMIKQA